MKSPADSVSLLVAAVESRRTEPFRWGSNDCCTFAAFCVDSMTGSDWVSDLADCYWDKASAYSYIAEQGGIEPAVTKRLGAPVPALLARRGDVCLVETPEGYGLAICVGASVVIPGESGLISKPLSEVIKAWRIS